MDVRSAVQDARAYLYELFQDEEISDVGLEEVVFDDKANEWNITLGFSRPWEQESAIAYELDPKSFRAYKVIRIGDDGTIKSLTDRVLPALRS